LEVEAAVEVRDVVVSAFEGDGFDRKGTFFEQAGGVVDAQVVDVVQPGFAEELSKVTGERAAAYAHAGGHGVHSFVDPE
jgi:hypothetical protein